MHVLRARSVRESQTRRAATFVRLGFCGMDGVVFVLNGERYPLSSGESATLDGYMRVPNLTLRRLRGRMKDAGDVGAEIEITDNEERGALRDSLGVASADRRHFTEGMERLHKAVLKPFSHLQGPR